MGKRKRQPQTGWWIHDNLKGTPDLEFTDMYDDGALAQTKDLNIRYLPEEVQFGVRKSFDRWANSVDFISHGIPETVQEMQFLLQSVHYCVLRGMYDPDDSQEFDLSQVRHQVRKEIRK